VGRGTAVGVIPTRCHPLGPGHSKGYGLLPNQTLAAAVLIPAPRLHIVPGTPATIPLRPGSPPLCPLECSGDHAALAGAAAGGFSSQPRFSLPPSPPPQVYEGLRTGFQEADPDRSGTISAPALFVLLAARLGLRMDDEAGGQADAFTATLGPTRNPPSHTTPLPRPSEPNTARRGAPLSWISRVGPQYCKPPFWFP